VLAAADAGRHVPLDAALLRYMGTADWVQAPAARIEARRAATAAAARGGEDDGPDEEEDEVEPESAEIRRSDVLAVWLLGTDVESRLARGEEIEVPLPKRRADVLAVLQAARQARPSIPDAAHLPTRQQPTAANPAPQPAFDATLVGRRVLALWGDSDEEPPRFEWFGATIVNFRAGPRITYRFVMHFDDGTTELVQLPDETVQILDETVSLCTVCVAPSLLCEL